MTDSPSLRSLKIPFKSAIRERTIIRLNQSGSQSNSSIIRTNENESLHLRKKRDPEQGRDVDGPKVCFSSYIVEEKSPLPLSLLPEDHIIKPVIQESEISLE